MNGWKRVRRVGIAAWVVGSRKGYVVVHYREWRRVRGDRVDFVTGRVWELYELRQAVFSGHLILVRKRAGKRRPGVECFVRVEMD